VPQIEIASYQVSSHRIKLPAFPTIAGGWPFIGLTPVNESEGVSVVKIIYSAGSTAMYLSGTEIYVYFAAREFRSHFAILRTEKPVLFEWLTDPAAGLITGVALKTGEEFAGEGELDAS
jgi:hypothetical protein